jgi:mannonate dehydratase
MVELFNNINEFKLPMVNQWFDFIRVTFHRLVVFHRLWKSLSSANISISDGISWSWNVSPVGHAAHAHIDLNVWNFGIQEAYIFSDKLQSIFTGCPTMKNGFMYVNERQVMVLISMKRSSEISISRSNWYVEGWNDYPTIADLICALCILSVLCGEKTTGNTRIHKCTTLIIRNWIPDSSCK